MEKRSYKWLGLLALIPAQGMIFMDQTILPVALPTIQQELGADDVALQWSVNSYLLLTAMFALAGGKFGDRLGHFRIYFVGLILFTLSSCLAGLSPSIGFLIGARALQGLGAAMIMPSQTALFISLFPAEERGRATGLLASVGSLFLIVGPLIGGYLTQEVSWRWIFWINLPIALLGLLLSRLYLPSTKPHPCSIDICGLAYFASCAGCTVLFFMQGRVLGWLSPEIEILFALSVASLLLLLKREKAAKQPSFDLSLFKSPVYAAINISISFITFILMITVFRAIYFQQILGYTPSQTGLLTFVSCVPVLFLSPVAGYLSDRYGPKIPLAIGYLSIIFSFFWLAFFSTPSTPMLLVSLLTFGIGAPLIFTPSYSAAMKAVPPKKLGIAFGMVATLRTLSATMGVALIGLLLDSVLENRLHAYAELPDAERLARIASFSVAHYVLGCLMAIACAAALTLHQRKSAHYLPDSPAEGWD